MYAEKASGIARGSLLVQVSPIKWTLAAGRIRRHKISIALHRCSACAGGSVLSTGWQAGVWKVKGKGGKVPQGFRSYEAQRETATGPFAFSIVEAHDGCCVLPHLEMDNWRVSAFDGVFGLG